MMDVDPETSFEETDIETTVIPRDSKLKGVSKKRRRRNKRQVNLQFYKKFKNVLRTKHNDLNLTHNSKCILESMVNDIFERLTSEAIKLQRAARRKTLTHYDMDAACSLLIGGSLQRYCKSAGASAVVKYLQSYKK